MSARNFDAKFGGGAPPAHVPHHVVLATQACACVLLLLVAQPPFVLVAPTADGRRTHVSPARVVVAAGATVGATVALHRCGYRPRATFTTACEFLYGMARSGHAAATRVA